MMISVAVIFILVGALVKFGKMYFLIAGYNTLPKEEKDKYDVAGIAAVMWNGLLGMAIIILLGHIATKWLGKPQIETYALFGALLIGMPYMLIKANSSKYRIERGSDRKK